MNVLSLGTIEKKRLVDHLGLDKMMHSFSSLDYLKLDSSNYINLKCQDYHNRVISIEQEYKINDKTEYDEIYGVKIHEITLREMLTLESFYVTKNSTEINKLIRMQPDKRFFFKTFLEFDCTNMCSILAFDSKSMELLLSEKNSQYFSAEFPVIYKNKMEKLDGINYYYSNAIDTASRNNQIKAV